MLAATVALLAATVACSDGPTEAGDAATPSTFAATASSDAPGTATAATPASDSGTPTAAAPSPTATAALESSAAPPAPVATPDTGRAMEHIRHLSEGIGPRPAGSEQEREAADYIATQLDTAGYDTQIEEFTFEAERDDSVVELPGGVLLRGLAMQGSPNGEAAGTAVHAGLGRPEDLAGGDLRGKVVIFERGTVTFGDKARAAEAAGAIGVIIVNDEPGLFLGSLGDDTEVSIPVIGVAGEDGDVLEEAIGERISAIADAGRETTTSQNVVGRHGDRCFAYLGAHYDSVTVSPGANDNASGTAVALEVARANPVDGLCVVLFGAEELGLFGSQDYVANHLAGTGRFMLNVDMAGRWDGPVVVGNDDLTDEILAALDNAGVEGFENGAFPPYASSDHVSFASVGVPSVTFNAGDDRAIHTAQDTMDRIDEGAVGRFLAAVDAALDALVDRHANVLAR